LLINMRAGRWDLRGFSIDRCPGFAGIFIKRFCTGSGRDICTRDDKRVDHYCRRLPRFCRWLRYFASLRRVVRRVVSENACRLNRSMRHWHGSDSPMKKRVRRAIEGHRATSIRQRRRPHHAGGQSSCGVQTPHTLLANGVSGQASILSVVSRTRRRNFGDHPLKPLRLAVSAL